MVARACAARVRVPPCKPESSPSPSCPFSPPRRRRRPGRPPPAASGLSIVADEATGVQIRFNLESAPSGLEWVVQSTKPLTASVNCRQAGTNAVRCTRVGRGRLGDDRRRQRLRRPQAGQRGALVRRRGHGEPRGRPGQLQRVLRAGRGDRGQRDRQHLRDSQVPTRSSAVPTAIRSPPGPAAMTPSAAPATTSSSTRFPPGPIPTPMAMTTRAVSGSTSSPTSTGSRSWCWPATRRPRADRSARARATVCAGWSATWAVPSLTG